MGVGEERDGLDLRDLDEVRRRVVVPVVSSRLRAEEILDVAVRVLPRSPFRSAASEDVLHVLVRAQDDQIEATFTIGESAVYDPDVVASHPYDQLQDEIAESRFAWGQLRHGDYEIPPPGF